MSPRLAPLTGYTLRRNTVSIIKGFDLVPLLDKNDIFIAERKDLYKNGTQVVFYALALSVEKVEKNLRVE